MKNLNIPQLLSTRLVCLILFSSTLMVSSLEAQVYFEQSGADLSGLNVTDYDKELILSTTQKVLDRYADLATFIGDDGTFSDDKYADFLGLFSGGARVYNDIVKKDADNVEYAVYADNIYQYMQGTGVKFELNDIYLEEIKYDSSGFYLVTLSMEKLMLNGLNENNVTTNYNNGVPVDLEMKIEMPDYDIELASILGLLGESRKVKVKKSSMITLDGLFYSGQVSSEASPDAVGFSGVDHPITYNAYGVESLYKFSINNNKTIWGFVGVQALFHNYNIDLINYDGVGPSDDIIVVSQGGAAFGTTTSDFVEADESTYIRILENVNSLGEDLRVLAIEVPVGISYNLASSYNYDFFIDAAIVPYYSISSDGGFYADGLKYLKIPNDTLKFPKEAVDYIIEKSFLPTIPSEISAYVEDKSNFDNNTSTVSNFSLGVMLSPTFHYKFSYKMAIEIGANIQYNFMPMFKSGPNVAGEDPDFLSYLYTSKSNYTSTLQNYYDNIGILRYGLKLGVVFKL